MGFRGELVSIEVDLRRGIPGMDVIGLAAQAVQEARDRVRVALRRCGFAVWEGRILVSLAPADLRKNGGGYDLALALGILQATGQVALGGEEPVLAMGELSLEGRLRPVNGVLGAALLAREQGIRRILVPACQHREAASVGGLEVWPLEGLRELPTWALRLASGEAPPTLESSPLGEPPLRQRYRLLRGPQREALAVAAAGGHHLLLVGPPGTGKTLAARALEDLLPPPTPEEEVEINRLASLAGEWRPEVGWIRRRPFRMVTPGATREGLCGGADLTPGEAARSHAGVLFLDEVLEFSSSALQSLRTPAQDGEVTVVRAGRSFRYPARFQLVMTANACPCGRLGSPQAACLCSRAEIHQYWKTLGGALLDRVDLRVWTPVLDPRQLAREPDAQEHDLLKRIERAFQIQVARNPQGKRNAHLDLDEIQAVLNPEPAVVEMWIDCGRKRGWSGRSSAGVLKVARTLADLEDRRHTTQRDLERALMWRLWGDLGWEPLEAGAGFEYH